MPRTALYLRVSTEDQAATGTIETQVMACRDYCRQQGLEIVEEYRDEGVSGSVPFADRPAAARLLVDAEARRFDSVLVYRLDRLAREVEQGIIATRTLRKLGVPAISLSESWDDSPNGTFMFKLFLSVAEFEKNLIRQRTMAGHSRSVKSGRYLASLAPFGYVYAEDGMLVFCSETAATVREMFAWSLAGDGLIAIANRLNAAGVPYPSSRHGKRQSKWGWQYQTVRSILTARRYIGKATYGRKVKKGVVVSEGIEMSCPALVDEATFIGVQDGLKRRKRNSSRNTSHLYLLQHLLHCRHCGARFQVKSAGRYRYYECRARATYGKRAGHEEIKWHWRADEIESIVKSAILNFESNPSQFASVIEIYRERLQTKSTGHASEINRLTARLAELASEEERAVRLAVQGRINDNLLGQQLDRIHPERKALRERLAVLEADEVVGRVDVEEILAKLREGVTWGRAKVASPKRSETQWRTDIQAMIQELWVEPDGTLTATGRLGDFLDLTPESDDSLLSDINLPGWINITPQYRYALSLDRRDVIIDVAGG